MFFYLLVFFVLLVISIGNNKSSFILSLLILILIAGLRIEGVDNDYTGYLEYYKEVVNNGFTNVEPTFQLLAIFVSNLFKTPVYLFVIYSILGVTSKYISINELTPYRMSSVLLYFSMYFLLFEMTQIRAGVAAGILLLSIKYIYKRKIMSFYILGILAVLFHLSALIILPFYFFDPHKFNKKVYLLIIPLSYVIFYYNVNVFSIITEYNLPIQLIQTKLTTYSMYAEEDNSINVFNLIHLIRCIFCLVFIYKSEFFFQRYRYFNVLLKIYCTGLFIYVSFAFIPGISSRISELLLIVEIILLPYTISLFKKQYIGRLVINTYSFTLLCLFLFYFDLLKPYFK